MLSEETLSLIENRSDAATPGPWISFVEGRDHDSGGSIIRAGKMDFEIPFITAADQDFIAGAREDIPMLTSEVRRLQKIVEGRR